MELHFDQELGALKDTLLRMSSLAEQALAQALKALVQRDDALARQVVADDSALDRLEVEVDERSIQLIALRQPKARDLRMVIMAMKISTDLERIGDQAADIAKRAIELNKEPLLKPLVDIPRMGEIAQGMIRDALDAFVYAKPDLARQVIARDEELDGLNKQLHRELTSFMVEQPPTITRALHLMTIARKLERIGDHATNIAEDIVYLYEARDIRHQHPPTQP
ncbi:MAG: phosphate signaling complex protein PhoU [Verrucomicrobia bacterium]|nr:phosphate signaling complex protein PhoU [Verrucomicrobiota bacterium]